jgi:hypothetical protein
MPIRDLPEPSLQGREHANGNRPSVEVKTDAHLVAILPHPRVVDPHGLTSILFPVNGLPNLRANFCLPALGNYLLQMLVQG